MACASVRTWSDAARPAHVRRCAGGSGDLAASPFRADRDRIVSSPFFARLGGVTQVISPGGSGLLVHNRLTHSLKVAQVARAIAERLVADERYTACWSELGGCDPDVVEAAALAHDLGHPPFGHLGEHVLDRLARQRLGLRRRLRGQRPVVPDRHQHRDPRRGHHRAGPDRRGPGGHAEVPVDPARPTRSRTRARWTRRRAGATPPPDDPDSGSAKFGAYTTELGRPAAGPGAVRRPDRRTGSRPSKRP